MIVYKKKREGGRNVLGTCDARRGEEVRVHTCTSAGHSNVANEMERGQAEEERN